jgi:hypothetical protein
LHYHWLSRHSLVSAQLLYNFPGKFHMFWHLCDQSKWMNPTHQWCYSSESYIGNIVRSARSCTAGTAMSGVARKVTENMLLELRLRLERG